MHADIKADPATQQRPLFYFRMQIMANKSPKPFTAKTPRAPRKPISVFSSLGGLGVLAVRFFAVLTRTMKVCL
ncbi:MAG: hypothetical protein K2Y31_15450 [Burkholderiales bacterium]|jgi:hypothetical protein|nr:hypothetical protein [Burkholderiales bacterium]